MSHQRTISEIVAAAALTVSARTSVVTDATDMLQSAHQEFRRSSALYWDLIICELPDEYRRLIYIVTTPEDQECPASVYFADGTDVVIGFAGINVFLFLTGSLPDGRLIGSAVGGAWPDPAVVVDYLTFAIRQVLADSSFEWEADFPSGTYSKTFPWNLYYGVAVKTPGPDDRCQWWLWQSKAAQEAGETPLEFGDEIVHISEVMSRLDVIYDGR